LGTASETARDFWDYLRAKSDVDRSRKQ